MMKLPIKRGATLRMANTPFHGSSPPYSFCGSIAALVIGGVVGSTVEASDYNYSGMRQNQSWDRQSSADYATRWDRGTKPWVREPSGAVQSVFGTGGSVNYGGQEAADVNAIGQRDWRQTGQSVSRSGDLWPADERHRAPLPDERRMEARRESGQWTSFDERRNPWSGAGNWPESDPRSESRSHSEYRNDWSTDRSWPQDAKSKSSVGAYGGRGTESRDWSRSSMPGSPNDYGFGAPAAQNRQTNDSWPNDPWRGSGSYAPATGSSQHQKHWGRSGKSHERDKPWETRDHTSRRFEQRSNLMGNARNTPPSDVMRPGYSEYPGYYSYPEQGPGVWGSLPGHGYYPGYYQGWGGGLYPDRNFFPMLDDSPWFLF
uniref:Uncharacterized protein n=1 Tax=Candidatus Kentrum sp. TC TaxID=2126339 RepID=A0A450ZL40_9GAMM|nr:MAG: hypothetical protein BECKTC1821F_GA0114240_100549 [Candidatus Kentron sp. TC]